MAWVQPIYDRTIEDIRTLTAKGKCSYVDLNRVCGDVNYLATLLNVRVSLKENWTASDVPQKSDWDSLVAAVLQLTAVLQPVPNEYLDLSSISSPPDWTAFNVVENDLDVLKIKETSTEDAYPRSGGEEYYGYVL